MIFWKTLRSCHCIHNVKIHCQYFFSTYIYWIQLHKCTYQYCSHYKGLRINEGWIQITNILHKLVKNLIMCFQSTFCSVFNLLPNKIFWFIKGIFPFLCTRAIKTIMTWDVWCHCFAALAGRIILTAIYEEEVWCQLLDDGRTSFF